MEPITVEWLLSIGGEGDGDPPAGAMFQYADGKAHLCFHQFDPDQWVVDVSEVGAWRGLYLTYRTRDQVRRLLAGFSIPCPDADQ